MVLWVVDRSRSALTGNIIVSVFGVAVFIGSTDDYPQGLAVWCARGVDLPNYEFTPLHPSAQQDVLVLAYRRHCGEE
jgi:hypothetical protein